MTLHTFTLDSGHRLLYVAGHQINGVSYYLRLKLLSVTCSYEHPTSNRAVTGLRICMERFQNKLEQLEWFLGQ